ncbi:MAG TPA: hypothetical protein VFD43_08635 [Planctomycetota bacterium]|nr:hypothetical protein [Planctomycetota bacterium]
MSIARMTFAVLLLSPILSADVIVVDARGGGDATTLSAAVAAAVDGDTILVRDGLYLEAGPVIVDGKALTIAAEWAEPWQGGRSVTIQPGLVVRNLAPGEYVVIENLALIGAPGTAAAAPTAALELRDNSSHVRVQGCELIGGDGAHNDNRHGAPGVDVENSYSTALTGCTAYGGNGQFSPSLAVMTGDGGPGLRLSGGQVHVGYSSLRGGRGGGNVVGGWAQGGNGGAGAAYLAGTLLVAGAGLHGGDGGISHFGGDGGDGLQVVASFGFAWLMGGSTANPGAGGWSDVGPAGANGQAIADPNGLVANHHGSPHGFDVTSPLREGQWGALLLDGDPTDGTLLFASLLPHQLPIPAKQGVLMLHPGALIGPFAFGFTGSGELPFLAPALPASLEALDVHLQPIYTGADGVVIGAGRVLTLLDAGF